MAGWKRDRGAISLRVESIPAPTADLGDITFSPSPANISTSNAEVRVSFRLAPGFDASYVFFDLMAPNGNVIASLNFPGGLERTGGSGADGIYSGVLTIPRYLAPGNLYYIIEASDDDDFSNTTSFGIRGEYPLPDGVPSGLPIVTTGIIDSTGPSVVSCEVSSTSVVVSETAELTIELKLQDDLSGVDLAESSFELFDPINNNYGGYFNLDEAEVDPATGILTMQVRFYGSAPSGEYALQFKLKDRVGNASEILSDALDFPGPFKGKITIIRPVFHALTSLIYTNPVVDVTSSPQSAEITLRVESTVDFSSGSLRFVYSESLLYATFGESERISGDKRDGTYRFSIQIPRYHEPGSLEPSVELYSPGHNDTFGIMGLPMPSSITTPNLTIVNTGPVDQEPPVITSFTLEGREFVAGVQEQGPLFSCTITDNLSGISSAYFQVDFPPLFPSAPTSAASVKLVSSEDGHTGVARGALRIPWWLPPGEYHLNLSIRDSVGNSLNKSTDAEGFPGPFVGKVTIKAPSGSLYTDWAITRGLEGAAPEGDADGDGISNFLELALGTHPKQADSFPLNLVSAGQQGRNGLPLLGCTFTNGRPKLSLTWSQHDASVSGSSQLVYEVWGSTDLKSWTKATGTYHQLASAAGTDRKVWQFIDNPASLTVGRYLRLHVRIP